jgi:hypothetical protein
MKSGKKRRPPKHRSPVPPPTQIHRDKRRQTRSQDKQQLRREFDEGG